MKTYYKKIISVISFVIALTTVHSSVCAHNHHGMYGPYPMTRESSGTSWQPQSTPMTGLMFMPSNWMLMVDGFVNFIYDHQGSERGGDKAFSNSMFMFMVDKDVGPVTFGFRSMLSLDPVMGKAGYPLILQTGETANGITPLIDLQHPHDFFMELAGTLSFTISDISSLFLYMALPGEPALGPPTFMHRWSGEYIPEAPITHHWLDSTHVTFGVITLGYVFDKLKVEGSLFNGREPDQNRWDIESPQFNSQSIRVSFNPTQNWAYQLSYGHIKSPEALEPNVNTDRTTFSILYNKPISSICNWQSTFAVGQNKNNPGHTLNGYLLESTILLHHEHYIFGRYENVSKDELFEENSPLYHKTFTVNKLSLGYLWEFFQWKYLRTGLGGLASTYSLPHGIQPYYGNRPFSYMIFARLDLAEKG